MNEEKKNDLEEIDKQTEEKKNDNSTEESKSKTFLEPRYKSMQNSMAIKDLIEKNQNSFNFIYEKTQENNEIIRNNEFWENFQIFLRINENIKKVVLIFFHVFNAKIIIVSSK